MPGIRVLILFGPTASGKTSILLNLFSGPHSGKAEVISADSMQVYRGMDIGTAKPAAAERALLTHHLLDIRNPNEQFTTGDFVCLAEKACIDISGRGKLPVISGGTGFYIRNLIMGLPEAPPSDAEIRAQLRSEFAERGAQSMMDELISVDSASAQRIHINDTYRLLRALEVFRLCSRPLSTFQKSGRSVNETRTETGPLFEFLAIAISRPRDELYRRINDRCEAMFNNGLPAEVSRLFDSGYTPLDPGLRAIGYREFFIENPDSGESKAKFRISSDITGVKALVSQNSRRYAKRQLTFFSGIPGTKQIEADNDDVKTARQVQKFIDQWN